MDNQPNDHDEDVVIIEQKDKRSWIYIGLATVMGIALGGLIGGAVAGRKWQAAYQTLEAEYHQLEASNKTFQNDSDKLKKQQVALLKQAFHQKLDEEKSAFQAQLADLKAQLSTAQAEIHTLKTQSTSQAEQLTQANQKNSSLSRQRDLQVSLLERSRELFQREWKVKQSLAQLTAEKETLEHKIQLLKKECDAYIDASNWTATSTACSDQDNATARLSKVNQLIRVNQMDLKEIQKIVEALGVE